LKTVMNRALLHLWSAVLGCALLLTPALAAAAAPPCPTAPPVTPISLPHLVSAISHNLQGVIVALGSSSTQGVMASDLAHSYPAILQQALTTALPESHVVVINRGIGGQDATEELARLESDVLAIRPQLVIWQVGANGALRNADPTVFHATVAAGVRRLQSAGADVILMDNQQSPALLAKAAEPLFDHQLAEVARDTGAALFSRRALMRAWSREGAPPVQFIASDGLHHNDHGYRCVALSLAQTIAAAVTPHSPVTASR